MSVNNRVNTSGDTSLILSVVEQDKLMIQLLLEKGADATICNIAGGTPMFYAVIYGYEEGVRLLVPYPFGERVKRIDHDCKGLTLVDIVSKILQIEKVNEVDIVKQLALTNKNIIGKIAKNWSNVRKCATIVKSNMPKLDFLENTPLIDSILNPEKTSLVKIEKLIQDGADQRKTNSLGYTPLFYAFIYGEVHSLNYLLESENCPLRTPIKSKSDFNGLSVYELAQEVQKFEKCDDFLNKLQVKSNLKDEITVNWPQIKVCSELVFPRELALPDESQIEKMLKSLDISSNNLGIQESYAKCSQLLYKSGALHISKYDGFLVAVLKTKEVNSDTPILNDTVLQQIINGATTDNLYSIFFSLPDIFFFKIEQGALVPISLSDFNKLIERYDPKSFRIAKNSRGSLVVRFDTATVNKKLKRNFRKIHDFPLLYYGIFLFLTFPIIASASPVSSNSEENSCLCVCSSGIYAATNVITFNLSQKFTGAAISLSFLSRKSYIRTSWSIIFFFLSIMVTLLDVFLINSHTLAWILFGFVSFIQVLNMLEIIADEKKLPADVSDFFL